MKYTVPYQENVRIAPFTSMRVGGNVRYLFRPDSVDAFCTLLCELDASEMPYIVIGNASNLLFADEGYDGAVVATTAIKELYLQDGKIVAPAAYPSPPCRSLRWSMAKTGWRLRTEFPVRSAAVYI